MSGESSCVARQLNQEEAQLLYKEWRRSHRSIGEPLHIWMGWTEPELERWLQLGKVPSEA